MTALNPIIGQREAAALAAAAHGKGVKVREIVLARGLMTENQLASALEHDILIRPHDARASCRWRARDVG